MKRRTLMLVAGAATALTLAGCTTNQGATASPAERQAALNKGADSTLATLYSSVPGSKELVSKARGVLVFPQVLEGAFGIGASGGDGVLRVNGATRGFYTTRSVSFGLQAGGQSTGLVYLFMTQDALDKFMSGNTWTAGADASVSVLNTGANGTIDTASANNAVNVFSLTNSGVFGGVSVNGARISKLNF
jgi:lipid-binding SYLF domain-containing protein